MATLGFFNGMPEISEPGVLNYYTISHLILLTLFVSRNLIAIHLPLSGSLDFLLCDLIATTTGLALFLPIPRVLAAASSFSSDRAYSSLNFLSSFDPFSDYAGINISLNNFPSLSFLNVYAPLFAFLQRIEEPTSFLSQFLPSPEISSF